MLGDHPAGLEPPAGARNRRKATVKRNEESLLKERCHESIPKIFYSSLDVCFDLWFCSVGDFN